MLQLLGYSEHLVKYCSANPSDPGAELLAVAKQVEEEPLRYPVTDEWCDRVREAITKADRAAGMKRGGHARLAEALGCTTAHLTDLLNGRYDTSPLVDAVHKYFGWEPPLPPTASLDAGELVHGYLRMTPAQRVFLDDARRVLQGESGEQAKVALAAMLKAFRTKDVSNED